MSYSVDGATIGEVVIDNPRGPKGHRVVVSFPFPVQLENCFSGSCLIFRC